MTWDEFLAARPTFRATFWADGEPLGSIEFRDEPFGQSLSQFFYCSVCDSVWGMIEFPNRHWLPAHVTCRQHRDERSEFCVPGSMLGPVDDLDEFPEAFVRREFAVHLEYYEQEIATWQKQQQQQQQL